MLRKPIVLIVYESRHGQTAKIAERIAGAAEARSVNAVVMDVERVPEELDPAGFDAVVVGGSVHYSRHGRGVRAFVREQREALGRVPSAFFSVSGHAIGPTPEGERRSREYVDAFVAETNWIPDHMARFGGAVRYTRYNPILRWVMKRIQKDAGRSTDTSRDHEYTDWGAVEDFAREVVRTVTRVVTRAG